MELSIICLFMVALFSFTAGFVAANRTWRIRRRSKLSNDAAVIARAQRRLERKREAISLHTEGK